MSGNAKQRRKRDRARAGYSKHWALVDYKSARAVLRAAREAGIPWRVYADEIATIKQRIADDIERRLAALYPLTIPQDTQRIEDAVRDAIERSVALGDLAPIHWVSIEGTVTL